MADLISDTNVNAEIDVDSKLHAEINVDNNLDVELSVGSMGTDLINDINVNADLYVDSNLYAELNVESNMNPELSVASIGSNITNEQLENLNKIPEIENSITELNNTKFDKVTASMNEDESATILSFYANDTIIQSVTVEGGSGGGVNITTFTTTTSNDLKVPENSDVLINYTFTTSWEDSGTLQITVNGSLKKTIIIPNGTDYINVTEFLEKGTNEVVLKVTNSTGVSYLLVFYVDVIDLAVKSTFNYTKAYNDVIEIPYTIAGAVYKTMHFILDGVEVETEVINNTSTLQKKYVVLKQEHGVHTFKMYATASVGDTTITSNIIQYDLICVVDGDDTVLISSSYIPEDIEQYTLISIPYIVYNPSLVPTYIELYVNDKLTNTLSVGNEENKWNISEYPYGEVTFSIRTGDNTIRKDFTINVTKMDVYIEEETNGLELLLTSKNRSNSDVNKEEWIYNDVTAELNGFNWTSNGWVLDDNGYSVLRINGGASALIPFQPFAKDFKLLGKTIEIEFNVSEVIDYDSTIVSCMNANRGFELTCRKAIFKSNESVIETLFKDNERIKVSFAIENSAYNRLIYTYVNGVISGLTQYVETDIFSQTNPVGITLGSNRCTLDIYTIRIYDNCLETTSIMNNYIYDLNDMSYKINLYNRNNIYDSYGSVIYSKILNQLPCMTITGTLPAVKGNKTKVRVSYENKEDYTKNFDYDQITIDIQGTSSQYYPKKNYKIKLSETYKLRDISVPGKVFCLKADYMESSHAHNTGMAKIVHGMYSEPVPPQIDNENVRTTVDGFPIALFHKETEDSEIKYFGVYNFNDDKDNVDTFGYPTSAECWEICNNTSPRCLFQLSDYETIDDEGNPEWLTDFEARYPEDYTDCTNLKRLTDWIVSTKNDPDKFKSEYESYFNKHYLLTYYILTEMFAMIDSRAKNMFIASWNKTIWYPVFYDMDTCFGLNNEGVLCFDYNVETQDTIGTQNVFNGKNSLLWQQVETALADDIAELYISMRDNGKLSYDGVLSVLEGEQIGRICEAQYNEDAKYKYLDPLINDKISTYLYIAQGNRLSHLKYWLYNRFNYMDSRYMASQYKANYATLRLYTPETYIGVAPNANFNITTYASQYVNIKFGSYIRGLRVENNQTVTITAPDITFNDTETIIYGASRISSLGDLSNKYAGTVDVSKATQLTELIIGSNVDGYSNTNLHELSIGNNNLLRKLDVRNCPNLTAPIDVSNCRNVEEIYAQGTNITSIKLPDSDNLKILHLPDSIANITLLNKTNIVEFDCEGYDKVTLLRVENSSVNSLEILSHCSNVEFVRMMKMNARCDYRDLDRLITCKGMDENGNEIEIKRAVSGKVKIIKCTQRMLDNYISLFPLIEFTVETLAIEYRVTFKDGDGNIIYECDVMEDSEVIYIGSTPTKTSTAQYNYEWSGWDTSLSSITSNCEINATFNSILRSYTITFVNSETNEIISTQSVLYGSLPEPPDFPEGLNSWEPYITCVTGEMIYSAIYQPYPEDLSIFSFSETTIDDIDGYICYLIPSESLPEYVIFPYEYNNKQVLAIGRNTEDTTGLANITSIYIPNSIKELTSDGIKYGAFSDLTSLVSVDIPIGVKTLGNCSFYNCSSLLSIDLPNVISIGHYCFTSCLKLRSINMPNVESLGQACFMYDSSITTIDLPKLISMGANCFYYAGGLSSIYIPILTELPAYGFAGSSSLTSIYGPNIITIGQSCFESNGAITNIDFPEAITIQNNAFYECVKLSSVNLPKAEIIYGNAFYKCSALPSIDLPNARILYGGSFRYCGNLSSINVPKVIQINGNSFQGCSFSNIDLPNLETFDGGYVFYGNDKLTTVNAPKLKMISGNSFRYTALKSIYAPNITTIQDGAFYGCRISEIDLTNVITIDFNAFTNCDLLSNVNMPSITKLGSNCFVGCTLLTNVVVGATEKPILSTASWATTIFDTALLELTIYTSDGTGDSITGSPWGATNATIIYEQA